MAGGGKVLTNSPLDRGYRMVEGVTLFRGSFFLLYIYTIAIGSFFSLGIFHLSPYILV